MTNAIARDSIVRGRVFNAGIIVPGVRGHITRLLFWLTFNGMCSMGIHAAAPADDSSGKQLARIACSACHVVESDSESPPPLHDPAPRFDEIANRPNATEKSLQQFITTTHWDGQTIPYTMPKPDLTRQQVVALSRYIMTLRKH